MRDIAGLCINPPAVVLSVDEKPSIQAIERASGYVPADLHVHIVLDNYGTHKTALIRNWFAKRPVFTCTSLPPAAPGSTWWSDGSQKPPTNAYVVQSSAV